MGSIAVCGGSVIGLAAAMMLARNGHEVTVLEADPSQPPDEPGSAWDTWDHRGGAQFHQPHNFFPRARQIMDADLPGLTDALLAAGGIWMDPMSTPPPTLTDFVREPEDERFRFVNARRPVLEAVFARAAAQQEGVVVRRGVRVAGLAFDSAAATPHVTGVLVDGERLAADLVVDAMGRRTKLPEWLSGVAATSPHLESQDSGFVYFTRYFRGDQPQQWRPASHTPARSRC